MLRCTPFLHFDGTCAKAMSFYHECIGGKLAMTKLRDTPMKAQFPPEKHDRVINANLKSDAIDISASDWMASPNLEPVKGNMSGVFLVSTTHEELKLAFNRLAVGAD